MDLFEYMRSTNMEKEAPLAARMRPRTLDDSNSFCFDFS